MLVLEDFHVFFPLNTAAVSPGLSGWDTVTRPKERGVWECNLEQRAIAELYWVASQGRTVSET